MNELTSLQTHYLKTSNIPIRYAGWSKSRILKDTGKFPMEIDDWLEVTLSCDTIRKPGGVGTTGVGMLFDGPPGEGKTTHSVVAAMEFIRQLPTDEAAIRKIMDLDSNISLMSLKAIKYITFPEFLSMKKASFDEEPAERREITRIIDGLHGRASDDSLNVRLLILDDLGKENSSSYNDTSFDELLRSRYDKGLPTIITTNVMLENWADQYGQAMGSFAHEAFQRIRIQNKDLRKA